ncbi:ribosome maturation factor RimM [Pseudalkalibacillus salsuginis]|uniref:ribosome maturation factor RimM n=1 Tax=Pseudalkalibacillus salsuginis TaxID=2910972 RepID=UPI001EEAEE9B|nr:ribosome maturation factor RimM [Pseudalkalibacillus salsuginis]MCF6410543.1 ribosome maturation factor RimM [Pseudalkalibacillus salsuginis]
MSEWFNVGKIVNTHGIRGEVRVITRSDFSDERYQEGSKLYLFHPGKNEPIPLVVRSHRKHKQFDLVAFEGYPAINDVQPLRDGILKVSKQQLEDLPEGEYYYYEIIGCEVKTTDGKILGRVTDILSPGANDVWAVYSDEMKKEFLIPYIEPVVKEVDVVEKQILIEPMEGLLE